MKRVYLKRLSQFHLECWVEVGTEVVAECKVIDAGDLLLVDEIYTKLGHRRQGHATLIVDHLKTIKNVAPAGIVRTDEAQGFWKNLGMVDALASKPELENLLMEHSTFELKIA